jgi:NTE family protein
MSKLTTYPRKLSGQPGKHPRIGLALGGGGARGIAHILILEVFDELGIRPSIITGTSIGAIYGAAYAAGLSAAYIRAHTEEVLSQRLDLVRQLVSARAPPVQRLFNLLPLRTGLLSAEAVLDRLLPSRLPATFEDLGIPLAVVATDFHAQEALLVREGALKTAVAASIALPALFAPVALGGRSLIDGGLVNPLPFDLITPAEADIIVAVDVSGGARDEGAVSPGALEALFASTQILQRSIVREKLKSTRPDIYIDSTVERFHMLEFHKFRDILRSAAPAKELLKRQLERVLAAETISEAKVVPDSPPALPKKKRRLLLPGRRKPQA